MVRKSLIFYVFISFLFIGLFAIILPNWISSPTTIILLAVIFKYIIGTHWKDSFKLAVINYVWILIFSILFITAEMIMTIQGQITSGKGLTWAFLLMIIGIPLTMIVINWTGNKNFEYSLFDKVFLKSSTRRNSHHRYHKRPENKNSITHFFMRFITFSSGIYISTLLLPFILVSNKIIIILLTGLIIESVSKIMQILVYHKKFIVNKYFIFWVIVQSLSFFIGVWLLSKIPYDIILSIIQEQKYFQCFSIIFVGLVVTLLGHLVWKTRIERKIFQ